MSYSLTVILHLLPIKGLGGFCKRSSKFTVAHYSLMIIIIRLARVLVHLELIWVESLVAVLAYLLRQCVCVNPSTTVLGVQYVCASSAVLAPDALECKVTFSTHAAQACSASIAAIFHRRELLITLWAGRRACTAWLLLIFARHRVNEAI